jgi:hypothetical protein
METKEIALKEKDIIANLVLNGDISKLTQDQKVTYYNMFCESLNLNPVTKPFQIIKFQGKEILYATKDATEQLRKNNGVSVIDETDKVVNDIYIVTVKLQDGKGRLDTGKGAVNIKGLSGDNLANAMMKAETKAKRRGTLSICGLGILDETELEIIPELKNIPLKKEEPKINKEIEIEEIMKVVNKLSDSAKQYFKDVLKYNDARQVYDYCIERMLDFEAIEAEIKGA